MKALIISFVTLVVLPNNNIKYDVKPETRVELYYECNRKLNWSDFVVKYNKPHNNNDVCMLSFELVMESLSSGNTLTKATIYCRVNKAESWVLNGYRIPSVLNHEQRHFDLAYAYAIKIVNAIKQVNTYSEADEIFNRMHQEMEYMQRKYDSEAGKLTLVEEQKKWDIAIDKMVFTNQ